MLNQALVLLQSLDMMLSKIFALLSLFSIVSVVHCRCDKSKSPLLEKCDPPDLSTHEETVEKIMDLAGLGTGFIPKAGEYIKAIFELINVLSGEGPIEMFKEIVEYVDCEIDHLEDELWTNLQRDALEDEQTSLHLIKNLLPADTPDSIQDYWSLLIVFFTNFPQKKFIDPGHDRSNIRFINQAMTIHLGAGMELFSACKKFNKTDCHAFKDIWYEFWFNYYSYTWLLVQKVTNWRTKYQYIPDTKIDDSIHRPGSHGWYSFTRKWTVKDTYNDKIVFDKSTVCDYPGRPPAECKPDYTNDANNARDDYINDIKDAISCNFGSNPTQWQLEQWNQKVEDILAMSLCNNISAVVPVEDSRRPEYSKSAVKNTSASYLIGESFAVSCPDGYMGIQNYGTDEPSIISLPIIYKCINLTSFITPEKVDFHCYKNDMPICNDIDTFVPGEDSQRPEYSISATKNILANDLKLGESFEVTCPAGYMAIRNFGTDLGSLISLPIRYQCTVSGLTPAEVYFHCYKNDMLICHDIDSVVPQPGPHSYKRIPSVAGIKKPSVSDLKLGESFEVSCPDGYAYILDDANSPWDLKLQRVSLPIQYTCTPHGLTPASVPVGGCVKNVFCNASIFATGYASFWSLYYGPYASDDIHKTFQLSDTIAFTQCKKGAIHQNSNNNYDKKVRTFQCTGGWFKQQDSNINKTGWTIGTFGGFDFVGDLSCFSHT